jgi:hypothetical protein
MLKTVGALVLGLVLIAAPAFAADVDGKWAGSIMTPNGDINIGFTFKADGAALSGSMTGMDGMEIPIKDGKVDGNAISFAVAIDFGGMPLELSYTGVVAAEQIQLTGDFMGMPFELVVKKQK